MKNPICFTTPVDFHQMKLFANFADSRYFDVDHLIDSVGNMPPEYRNVYCDLQTIQAVRAPV